VLWITKRCTEFITVFSFYYHCHLADMLRLDGDADAAMEATIRIGWNKLRRYNYLPIGIYHWLGEWGCTAVVCQVVCYMEVKPGLSGKKTKWHFSKQRRELSDGCVMLRQKIKSQVKSWERGLGIDAVILVVQQNRLRWYGHVLRNEDTDWVKKCMEH